MSYLKKKFGKYSNTVKWAITIFLFSMSYRISWGFPSSATTTLGGQVGYVLGAIMGFCTSFVIWIGLVLVVFALIGLFPPLGRLMKDKKKLGALILLIATILKLIATVLVTQTTG